MKLFLELTESEIESQSFAPRGAQLPAQRGIFTKPQDCFCQSFGISVFNQQAGFIAPDNFRNCAASGGNYRLAIEHRFEIDNPKPFTCAGQYEDITFLVQTPQRRLINRPQKINVAV